MPKSRNQDMNIVVHLWMERIEIQCKELETSQGTFQDLNALTAGHIREQQPGTTS